MLTSLSPFARLLAAGSAAILMSSALVAQGDECTGALAIGNGVGVYTNVGSTTSAPAISCGAGGPDVWFSYCTLAAGTLTVTTCDPATTFDTVLQIYSGTCGGLVSLGCNDDLPFCPVGNGLESMLSIPVSAGMHWIRVGGWGSGTTGTFGMTVTGPATNLGTFSTTQASGCDAGLGFMLSGQPWIGGTVTASMSGYSGFPLVTWGLQTPTQPFTGGCALCYLLTGPSVTWQFTDTISLTIPCAAAFLGLPLQAQGADVNGSPSACSETFGATFDLAFTDIKTAHIL